LYSHGWLLLQSY
jgi:hypothetical protein